MEGSWEKRLSPSPLTTTAPQVRDPLGEEAKETPGFHTGAGRKWRACVWWKAIRELEDTASPLHQFHHLPRFHLKGLAGDTSVPNSTPCPMSFCKISGYSQNQELGLPGCYFQWREVKDKIV